MQERTAKIIASDITIVAGGIPLFCDIVKCCIWVVNRRSPTARYKMYLRYADKLSALGSSLHGAELAVVNAEKRRVYLKMLKIWARNGNLRDANPLLPDRLQSMKACGLKLDELNELNELDTVIQVLAKQQGVSNEDMEQQLQNDGLL